MTLSLEEKIIENAKQKALQIAGEIGRELVVDRLCIGVGYTGIVLSDGHGGRELYIQRRTGKFLRSHEVGRAYQRHACF